MAWAMPQAIERSVASPTIRARLPARNPMHVSPSLRGGEAFPSAEFSEDDGSRVQQVPGDGPWPAAREKDPSAAAGGDPDRELLALEDQRCKAHTVPAQDLGHGHLDQFGDLTKRIAGPHDVDDPAA